MVRAAKGRARGKACCSCPKTAARCTGPARGKAGGKLGWVRGGHRQDEAPMACPALTAGALGLSTPSCAVFSGPEEASKQEVAARLDAAAAIRNPVCGCIHLPSPLWRGFGRHPIDSSHEPCAAPTSGMDSGMSGPPPLMMASAGVFGPGNRGLLRCWFRVSTPSRLGREDGRRMPCRPVRQSRWGRARAGGGAMGTGPVMRKEVNVK